MRPLIVDWLNRVFHTSAFAWLVPAPAVMYAVALTAGLLVFMNRARKDSIPRYHAAGAVLSAMLGGMLGTRLVYLLFHWQQVQADPAELFSLTGGTISWGAYLGGIAGLVIYFMANRIVDPAPARHLATHSEWAARWKLLDAAALALALGIGLGRWACFLNGDDFGKLSQLPWAVRYPPGSFPYLAHLQAGWLEPGAQLSLPVHPVQLYLSLNGFLIFCGLSLFYPRLRSRPGYTFGLFWLAYGAARFLLEFFRADYPPVLWDTFTPAQIVCTVVVLLAGAGIRLVMAKPFVGE